MKNTDSHKPQTATSETGEQINICKHCGRVLDDLVRFGRDGHATWYKAHRR